jgi:hypothetical protein
MSKQVYVEITSQAGAAIGAYVSVEPPSWSQGFGAEAWIDRIDFLDDPLKGEITAYDLEKLRQDAIEEALG